MSESQLVKSPPFSHPKALTNNNLFPDFLDCLTVVQHSDDHLQASELTIKTEEKQHYKEEKGPERREWQECQGLGEDYECKARTLGNLLGKK